MQQGPAGDVIPEIFILTFFDREAPEEEQGCSGVSMIYPGMKLAANENLTGDPCGDPEKENQKMKYLMDWISIDQK